MPLFAVEQEVYHDYLGELPNKTRQKTINRREDYDIEPVV
jgi:hypothetical protein